MMDRHHRGDSSADFCRTEHKSEKNIYFFVLGVQSNEIIPLSQTMNPVYCPVL